MKVHWEFINRWFMRDVYRFRPPKTLEQGILCLNVRSYSGGVPTHLFHDTTSPCLFEHTRSIKNPFTPLESLITIGIISHY